MIPNYPTLGALFDIEKAYGEDAWKVFWGVVNPELIRSSLLYAGDTDATLNRRDNVFCIAIQCSDSKTLEQIKTAFGSNPAFLQVAASPQFVEGHACSREPLVECGRIDASGNFIGDPSSARTALGSVRNARSAALPTVMKAILKPRVTPASERTRNLPGVSSFRELKGEIKKIFMAPEYSKYLKGSAQCWLTPDEVADVVEKYSDLVLITYREYSVPITEDMCNVTLYDKQPSGMSPIDFKGLFPFASANDATNFCNTWRDAPDYANALPRLADIRGKYHLNFYYDYNDLGFADEHKPKSGVTPEVIWEHLSGRKERFLADLQKHETAGRQAMATRRDNLKTPTSTFGSTRKPWWKGFWKR